MRLYRLENGVLLDRDGTWLRLDDEWDAVINRDDLAGHLRRASGAAASPDGRRLAPIGSQEVWAAGVTYFRSRTARMEESKASGGGTFYDRVYAAERPELFFKAAAWRVRGPGDPVRIRRDARWSVPEPELALVINRRGAIVGYTIGNDMSSRDIEGENPLYLPQAKVYDGSCALGPGRAASRGAAAARHDDRADDHRAAATPAFQGETTLAQMRRSREELVEYLYRETSFPHGVRAADRHRHRSAGRLHAAGGRCDRDHDPADRHAGQRGGCAMTRLWGLRWWMIGLLMLGVDHQLPHAQHARRSPRRRCSRTSTSPTQQYSWIVGAFQVAIMLQPICGYVLDTRRPEARASRSSRSPGRSSAWRTGSPAAGRRSFGLRALLGFAEGSANPAGMKATSEWFPATRARPRRRVLQHRRVARLDARAAARGVGDPDATTGSSRSCSPARSASSGSRCGCCSTSRPRRTRALSAARARLHPRRPGAAPRRRRARPSIATILAAAELLGHRDPAVPRRPDVGHADVLAAALSDDGARHST